MTNFVFDDKTPILSQNFQINATALNDYFPLDTDNIHELTRLLFNTFEIG